MAVVSSISMDSNQPVRVNIGDYIDKKYQIIKVLGQGGFGAVYEVRTKTSKESYALKLETELAKPDEPGLDLEVGVMKRLRKSSHVTRYVDHGKIGKFTFIVMQLVGTNLADLRRQTPKLHFTVGTAFRLGLQSLDCIEDVHNMGLLHRDIKPANFAMGRTQQDCRRVYIFDFGLVRRFRLKNGKIRAERKSCGFRGTSKYASLRTHEGKDMGRVDDLCSWLYMVAEFQNGGLPWRCETDRDKIHKIKVDNKTKLFENLDTENLHISLNLNSLDYADSPPYYWYKEKLLHALQRIRCQMSDPYDWEEKGAFGPQMKVVRQTPSLKSATKPSDYSQEMKSQKRSQTEDDMEDEECAVSQSEKSGK